MKMMIYLLLHYFLPSAINFEVWPKDKTHAMHVGRYICIFLKKVMHKYEYSKVTKNNKILHVQQQPKNLFFFKVWIKTIDF